MSAIGTAASWLAAALGAWAFMASLAATDDRPQLQRSAERALWMSGAFALIATMALATLLVHADMTVSYVARGVARNLPATYRLAALWSFPHGAVLPTAVLVAVAGTVATRRAHTPYGIAASGASVGALLAASLAVSPFATLSWLPADGLGMSPSLQNPEAVLARVLLTCAVACAAGSVAAAADALSSRGDALSSASIERWLWAALVALALTALLAGEGASAAGEPALSPLGVWRGALLPALAAIVLAQRAAGGSDLASLRPIAAALGALGLTTNVLLGMGGASSPNLVRGAFVAICTAAAAWGALPGRGRPADAGRDNVATAARVVGVFLLAGAAAWAAWSSAVSATAGPGFLLRVVWPLAAGVVLLWLPARGGRDSGTALRAPLVTGALLCFLLATVGEMLATSSVVRLTSGETASIRGRVGGEIRLAHQGISRYESANSHVVAAAIEITDSESARLLSPQRREYVDSRDAPIGALISLPGIHRGILEEVRANMIEVQADDSLSLRVTSIPFALGWRLGVVLLAMSALAAPVAASFRRTTQRIDLPVIP